MDGKIPFKIQRHSTNRVKLLNSHNSKISIMVQLSSRDRRSIIGKNLFFISDLTCKNLWSSSATEIKRSIPYAPVPPRDIWRLQYLQKFLFYYSTLDSESPSANYTKDLISSLCIS